VQRAGSRAAGRRSLARLKTAAHRVRRAVLRESSADYWTRYNVTLHHAFVSAAESLEYFEWRSDQYIDYLVHMPVAGRDGAVVLDYGCGPGHDLVGFSVFSRPDRLIGVDVSAPSLEQARTRLALHGWQPELHLLREGEERLPLADASVDYIHSSGVLHHVPDPARVLREFARVLKPGGEARVMVYNYDSLWLHLHVAYVVRVGQGLYGDLPIREAFSRFTDGEECPLAVVYTPAEFTSLAGSAGLGAEYLGAALAVAELADWPLRCDAIMDRRLEAEHRRFLVNLTIDHRGLPTHGSTLAGHDACYRLTR
jgi:ubiquinone/menaquinone biosynthesis C-methylase UbiE